MMRHDDEVETSAETEGDARRDAGGRDASGCSRMLSPALTPSHTLSERFSAQARLCSALLSSRPNDVDLDICAKRVQG